VITTPAMVRALAADRELLEVGRKAVEDVLIEFRDARIGVLRNNGLVVRERDGTDSHIIRLGVEDGVAIALRAIADHLEGNGHGKREEVPS
jgi:hypothetical protein